MEWLARWSLRLVLVALAAVGLWVLAAQLWRIVLPVLLAVLLSAVLQPLSTALRRRGAPAAVAAALVLGGGLAAIGGLIALVAMAFADGIGDIATSAVDGVGSIRTWVTGPPLELDDGQVQEVVGAVLVQVRTGFDALAGALLGTVAAITTGVVTVLLALVLTFLFLKDADRFAPWLRRTVGNRAGGHLVEAGGRVWRTLGAFVRVQAVVSLVDAVFIGLGLVVMGVPLAFPLAVLTFLGGFVPIVGALVAGALAVLVALVSNGLTTAVIVLVIIVVVQQVESNVLQPVLQGRSLRLHPAVVLLAVTAGGTLFGITGAFLAVPLAAAGATTLRYLGELAARPDTGSARRTVADHSDCLCAAPDRAVGSWPSRGVEVGSGSPARDAPAAPGPRGRVAHRARPHGVGADSGAARPPHRIARSAGDVREHDGTPAP